MDRRLLVIKSFDYFAFVLTEINATFTFQSILEIANTPGNKNKKLRLVTGTMNVLVKEICPSFKR